MNRKNKNKKVKNLKNKPEWDFFISICVKGSNDLRSFLKMSEDSRKVSGYSHHFVRDFYIYQILDEIEKIGISLVRNAEFLGGEDSRKADVSKDRVKRNIVTSIVDEQNMWLRKLTEILIEVVCFQQSNMHDYYRHYLILQDLRSAEIAQLHYKDFYNIKNYNIDHQINDLKNWDAKILEKLDKDKVWYVTKDKKNNPTTKFKSFRLRLKENHKLFTKNQLINIGLSPEFYSKYCKHIHPALGDMKSVSIEEIEENIGHLALVAHNILITCKKLLKVRAKKGSFLAQLSRIDRENKYPGQLYKKMTTTDAELGDFVLISDHLAEVLEIIKSDTGYMAIKILFLDRPMMKEIPVDIFPSRMIRLIQKGKKLRDKTIEVIKRIDPKAKISKNKIREATRASILHAWNNAGLKEYYFGDRSESEKKRKKAEEEMQYIRKKLKLD